MFNEEEFKVASTQLTRTYQKVVENTQAIFRQQESWIPHAPGFYEDKEFAIIVQNFGLDPPQEIFKSGEEIKEDEEMNGEGEAEKLIDEDLQ